LPKQTAASSRRRGDAGRASGPRAARVPSRDLAAEASEPASRGAATLTDGLDSLDRERASSLADEGGTAGAAVEAQTAPPATVAGSGAGKLWLAALWGLAALAALYLRRSR
jgi:hypothetical protein